MWYKVYTHTHAQKSICTFIRNIIHSSDSLTANNFICTDFEKTIKVQKTLDTHYHNYHKNCDEKRETIVCPYDNERFVMLQPSGEHHQYFFKVKG